MRIHQTIQILQKKTAARPSLACAWQARARYSQTTHPKRPAGGSVKLALLLCMAVCAAAAGVFVALQTSNTETDSDKRVQTELVNTTLLPVDFKRVPEFSMLDKDGAKVSAELLEGQWSLLFFGFTYCPDVCPTTLNAAAQAIKQIDLADDTTPLPNVVFVSVDPKRDTPEILKKYVEFFNPDFNALTGTVNQMYELITPLNVVVNYTVDEDNPDEYTVDHTAAIMLIDPELRLRAKFNGPHKAKEIAADYQTLLEHLSPPS